jgi:pimeloyl-ACP methyl ester carboxylesterase
VLDAKPLSAFEQRAPRVRGGRVRYFVGGEGPPIVLVHGLGGAATNWTELAAILSRRFRVLVPDLPGHGGSEPLPAGCGLAPFADRVALCAEREAMLPACLVGHSLGGAIALRLALRRPESVSALVLAAAAGISSSSVRARAGLAVLGFLRPSRFAARYRDHIAESPRLKRLVFRMLAGDTAALSAAGVHGFLAGSELVTDLPTAADGLFAEDARTELDTLRCPALVLWGARDWFLTVEDGFEYARRLGAPLRMLADTGHLLIAERPEQCASLIGTFLDGVRQVEELPLEAEAIGQLRGQRLNAERLGRVVPRGHEVQT